MNATIELGTPGDLLDFEEGRHAFRLYPAVAGAQAEVRLRVSRTRQDNEATFRVAATLYFGNGSHNRLRVGPIAQTGTVTATERQRDVVLAGFISNEQLRIAEELRSGGDLWLTVEFDISALAAQANGLRSFVGELAFPVTAGEWCAELDRIDASTWVELLVPVPADTEHAQMVHRIKDARALLRTGDIDAALNAARLGLEPVLTSIRINNFARNALDTKPRERDLQQRFAVMVEDTYSTLSGAAHDDDLTKGFRYTRADAVLLVTTTAGLIHQHVSSPRETSA